MKALPSKHFIQFLAVCFVGCLFICSLKGLSVCILWSCKGAPRMMYSECSWPYYLFAHPQDGYIHSSWCWNVDQLNWKPKTFSWSVNLFIIYLCRDHVGVYSFRFQFMQLPIHLNKKKPLILDQRSLGYLISSQIITQKMRKGKSFCMRLEM